MPVALWHDQKHSPAAWFNLPASSQHVTSMTPVPLYRQLGLTVRAVYCDELIWALSPERICNLKTGQGSTGQDLRAGKARGRARGRGRTVNVWRCILSSQEVLGEGAATHPNRPPLSPACCTSCH